MASRRDGDNRSEGGRPAAEILDVRRLLERYQGDRGMVEELYQAFREDGPVKMERIRSARDNSDLESLGRVAHSLKSVAGAVFAPKAAHLAAELQSAALAGEAERAWRLADDLEAAMVEVLDELHRTDGGV